MKVLSVTLIGFILISHGFSQDIYPQLIGGSRTTIANFPYLAGIFTRNFFTCGGAIINFRSVLTVSELQHEKSDKSEKVIGYFRQLTAFCQHRVK